MAVGRTSASHVGAKEVQNRIDQRKILPDPFTGPMLEMVQTLHRRIWSY
jgi:hypothetical protein